MKAKASLFFFEKKNQKTFVHFAPRVTIGRGANE
jgi:hypothetical protein